MPTPNAHIIHLETSIDRLPLIKNLEKQSGLKLQIFFASDGSDAWNNPDTPKLHPWRYSYLSQGMVGCTESHIGILQKDYTKPFFIFEDDAELVVPFEAVQKFIESVKCDWDILLLSANEYIESAVVTADYSKIGRFWGTHAMLVNPKCCSKIIDTFTESWSAGIFLPADWLYNEAIRKKGLAVYGPPMAKQLFKQKDGLKSLITGNIR